MPRRRRHEEPENHERWLVSYADFITLLFAFFVVMYAVSSVNEGKYRVLSDSLMAAFSGPARSLHPVQIGEMVRVPVAQGNMPATSLFEVDTPRRGVAEGGGGQLAEGVTPPEEEAAGSEGQGPGARLADMEALGRAFEESLASLIDDDLVTVRRHDEWVEVEIKTSILFASGSARLFGEAVPVLEELAGILARFPNPVQVEGFTDNVPISTLAYPSNWELSAARAASVVHLFTRAGVLPERMVAIGYGEYRPVADNDTPEGRAKNRRVVIVIPADRQARRALDVDRMAAPEAAAGEAGGAS
jgi:chemotaxis protein MotB